VLNNNIHNELGGFAVLEVLLFDSSTLEEVTPFRGNVSNFKSCLSVPTNRTFVAEIGWITNYQKVILFLLFFFLFRAKEPNWLI
jgi:hypothetical protein